MKVITPIQARNLIKRCGYHIGYVEFVKLDGTYRKMWFQGKISPRLLKGGDRAYNPEEHQLSWVRDIMLPAEDCVRSVKWYNIKKLSVNNERYIVNARHK